MLTRALAITVLGIVLVLGVIATVVAPGMALGGAGFGALIGMLGWLSLRESAPGEQDITQQARRRAGLIVGTVVTAGWLAVTALALLLGPATVPTLLLLVLVTLAVWWWRRPDPHTALRSIPWRAARGRLLRAAQHASRPPRRQAEPRPDAAAPPAPTPVLMPVTGSVPIPADLTTPQLCVAWQRTYLVLLSLPAGDPRGEVVALRARLLDEIESRDPDGFTRWLDTGARAGSDPGRYLAGDR